MNPQAEKLQSFHESYRLGTKTVIRDSIWVQERNDKVNDDETHKENANLEDILVPHCTVLFGDEQFEDEQKAPMERPSLAKSKSAISFRLLLGGTKQGGSARDLQEGRPKLLQSKSVILHGHEQDDSSHTAVEQSGLQERIRELEARVKAAMQMRTDEPGNNSHADDRSVRVEEGDAEKKIVGLNRPDVREEGKKNDIDEVNLPRQETMKRPSLYRPPSMVLYRPKNDSSRLPEEASPTRQVRFKEVIVRHYAMTLGDHPNCRYVTTVIYCIRHVSYISD